MRSRRRKEGFTLFELLTTMAIVAILAGGLAMTIRPGQGDQGIENAQSQLLAMMRVARSQAILAGTESRLIVNVDRADPDRFLRFVGIVVRESDGSKWVSAHKGIYLAQGVYVVPDSAKPVSGVVFSEAWTGAATADSDAMSDYPVSDFKIDYPSALTMGEGGEGASPWIGYEFTPQGKLGSASSNYHIALAKTSPNASGELEFANRDAVIGIRARYNGTAFPIDSADAL